MANKIKLGIIGDFNHGASTHHATNMAVEHAAGSLNITVDYYWIRPREYINDEKKLKLEDYDGFWVAPGPFESEFFLSEILKEIVELNVATFITGYAFKPFVELMVNQFRLIPENHKIISEDMNEEVSSKLNRIQVHPLSKSLISLYKSTPRTEFSGVHFSIYPQIINQMQGVIDVEAVNDFDEPEIISHSLRQFCVASMSLPQISSGINNPHPLILSFFNYLKNKK